MGIFICSVHLDKNRCIIFWTKFLILIRINIAAFQVLTSCWEGNTQNTHTPNVEKKLKSGFNWPVIYSLISSGVATWSKGGCLSASYPGPRPRGGAHHTYKGSQASCRKIQVWLCLKLSILRVFVPLYTQAIFLSKERFIQLELSWFLKQI